MSEEEANQALVKQSLENLAKYVKENPRPLELARITRSLKTIEGQLSGTSPGFATHVAVTIGGVVLVLGGAMLLTPANEAITSRAVLLVGAALLVLGASLTVHRSLSDAKADAYGAPVLLLLFGTIVLAQAVYSMKPAAVGPQSGSAALGSATSDSTSNKTGSATANSATAGSGGSATPSTSGRAMQKPAEPPAPPPASVDSAPGTGSAGSGSGG